MVINYIRRLKTKVLLGILILTACFSHLLFLAQIDYVVYDHDQRHTARPALKGYYQLQDGKIGNFMKDMFNHHEGDPRYPAFIGYLMALFCYLFGLNEVVMRYMPLLFYLILIYYTYKCAKEMDSEETGILSILILITMPAMVFWSRMIFPTFFGIVFLMAAFYYMLRTKYFCSLGNSALFGFFSGLCLLTHRVMFIPLSALWIVAIVSSLKRENILKTIKGLVFASLAAFVVSGRFLITYFKTYDRYRDFCRYSLFIDYSSLRYILGRLKRSVVQLGYDNLAIIFLLIILAIFWKHKKKLPDKAILFQYFAAISFCLFLGIWFVVTYFAKQIINVRHFQILAPMIAIIIAIYLNKTQFLIKYVVISIKTVLVFSLLIMILPQFGNSPILHPFRNYYRTYYHFFPMDNIYGNGVIWSDITFARKEELDYFKEEISKGDIAVMNMFVKPHLVSLSDRLQFNGIGRAISFEDVNLSASYLMFYCASSDNLKVYLAFRKRYAQAGSDKAESLLKIEKFINANSTHEIGNDEKIAIFGTGDNYFYADIIEKYITNFKFKITRCLKYHVEGIKMYKVILKCTESLSELKNFEAWRKHQSFLRKP